MNDLKAIYPEISDVAISFQMPLMWGDMDSAKHVNNLIYLKWIETSRIKLFELVMDTSFDGKKGPILGWQDCKYIFPMTYPDEALITARIKEILVDRFIVESRIYSIRYNKLAAISQQSVIPYDYVELKKIDLPDDWVKKLSMLM